MTRTPEEFKQAANAFSNALVRLEDLLNTVPVKTQAEIRHTVIVGNIHTEQNFMIKRDGGRWRFMVDNGGGEPIPLSSANNSLHTKLAAMDVLPELIAGMDVARDELAKRILGAVPKIARIEQMLKDRGAHEANGPDQKVCDDNTGNK